MLKKYLSIISALILVLAVTACGAAGTNKKLLIGTWQAKTEGEESETFGYAFTFGKDGKLSYDLSGLKELGIEGEEFEEGVEALGQMMSLNYEVVDNDTIALYVVMFGMKGDADEIAYELIDENTLVLDGVTYIRVK
ncbi:MAG: hypothetical protein BWY11_01550 [Firmicutes bacterium ADurb.Bin182]|nr:MAG: hypothetical protein BWY11_01550 [Firmicutes bacterium ADurb.Bin182]